MKKILLSIVAVVAIAACSKSEVAYEASSEIALAPMVKNATKAVMENGPLSVDQNLGVWAYWDRLGSGNFNETYFENALFVNTDESENAWGAPSGVSYPWPLNGSLKFAGYTIPDETQSTFSAAYKLTENTMTFGNFIQPDNLSETFDLCWFSATGAYDRTTDGAIPVTLSHALTWLSFNVRADEGVTDWKINSIVLHDIAGKGTGVCKGTGADAATWTCDTYDTDVTLLSTPLTLTNNFVDIEGDAKSIVVIPQTINAHKQIDLIRTQHTLKIDFTTSQKNSAGVEILSENLTRYVKLDISTDPKENRWKSGVHYTYNITFSPNKILITPIINNWESDFYIDDNTDDTGKDDFGGSTEDMTKN